MINGRTTLSLPATSTMLHSARKMAHPVSPCATRVRAAGTHTSAVPTMGISEATAPTPPNTSGEGSPAMAKPMPTSVPCTSAVTSVPNTTARVTPPRVLARSSLAPAPWG